MRARRFLLGLVWAASASVLGCASGRSTEPASGASPVSPSHAEEPPKPADTASKRRELERQVAIAREKLRQSEAEVELQRMAAADDDAKRNAEIELAKAELDEFDKHDAPSRIAKARLDLAQARDALDEQKEELAQLEATYADGDLADKTREIVLNRGKRRVARAEQRLAIAEGEAQTLEELTIRRERAKLELAVEQSTRDVRRAKESAENEALSKRIAVMSAEADVARVEAELAALGTAKP
jgi:hypothetical protein